MAVISDQMNISQLESIKHIIYVKKHTIEKS